jgi:radical SAM protein with 4Fe4S-binding SPASM domain
LYYRLQKYCTLVEGAKRGAIYNFQTGKVFSINGSAVKLLHRCQKSDIDDLVGSESSDSNPLREFLDSLTAMGVGSLYIKEPADTPAETEPATPQLEFLWLELTSNCNNKCLHCYATSGPCINNDCVPPERWLSLISEARQSGASAIQLIGGEPLLYPKWRELVIKASEEGFDLIEIFTNATLIDDPMIEFFKQYKVNIATTIYANNSTTHDTVTLHPGSFEKTLTAVKKIRAANIPLRVASIIMKANEHEVQNIMELCAELGVDVNPPDIVRPTGRGDDHELLPTVYSKPPIKPPFFTDQESFAKAKKLHSCLAGRLAITSTGDVIPCIFARSQVCGSILSTSLAEILDGPRLQQCWHTTKDHIEKCKDCEYRYACTDCRPHAQGSDPNKRWLACSRECSYDPSTGIWEGEIQPKSCNAQSNTCPYGKKKS